MASIYLADDEKEIREILSAFLKSDGHNVTAFETGDQLLTSFKQSPCDLILLDIMMPGTDGITILTSIREISKVPIILVTAKDTDNDCYSGLALGSDDYIVKPFKPMLLSAKIRALLRRVEFESQTQEVPLLHGDALICGNLSYSDKCHEFSVNNQIINVTPTETKFLTYMMRRFGEAVSRDELLEAVWGMNFEIETRVADETNRRIRKKLTNAGANVYVQTVWGYGFKMSRKEEA